MIARRPQPPAPLFEHAGAKPGTVTMPDLRRALGVPEPEWKDRAEDQCARVLAELKAGRAVTPAWAREHGIMRLAARIHGLREAGHAITSRIDAVTREAEYRIESPAKGTP